MYCFIYLLCLAIATQSFIINTSLQSPCPDVFQYQTRNDFYQYGLLTVPSPPLDRPAVSLVMLFVLRGRLPTQYGGLLELQRSRQDTIHDILHQQPVRFIVNFPVQAPLPRLVFVSFDNRVICGHTDTLMLRRHALHKIEFRYTFNTSGLVADVNPLDQAMENGVSILPHDDSTSTSNLINTLDSSFSQFQITTFCGVLHDKFASTPLVVGGTSIERGSWPWLVAIYAIKSTGPLFRCAGTLVSDHFVLTAASCFWDADRQLLASHVMVNVGRFNLSDWLERDTDAVPVLSIHEHMEFETGSADFDIALLVLSATVRLGEYVQPVCLWSSVDEPTDPTGLFGTIVGWGVSTKHGQSLAMTPNSLTIPVVSESFCQRIRDPFSEGQENAVRTSFCAGNRNAVTSFESCQGDLGSGFVTLLANRLALRGIVSKTGGSGRDCNLSSYLVLTDVAKHTNWLRRVMGK